MDIGTYNIRAFGLGDWGFKSWLFRRSDISDVILKCNLKVCALQEVGSWFHRRSLLARLNRDFDKSVYAYYGGSVGVLYRKDLFSVFDKGAVSVTNPFSFIGAFGSLVWVGLLDKKTSQKFYVFSVFLHRYKSPWVLDNKLLNLKSKISHVLKGSDPFVVAGTFNFSGEESPFHYNELVGMFPSLKDASVEALISINNNHGTFNNFGLSVPSLDKRFDYVLTSGFRLPMCKTVESRDSRGAFPSDHFPIVSFCEFES